jgi:hypothetical protein
VNVSVDTHKSKGIAIVAHHDCGGNPIDRATQLEQLETAILYLKREYPDAKVIGLWVDEKWNVQEV